MKNKKALKLVMRLFYITSLLASILYMGGCAGKTNHKFYFSEKGIVRVELSQDEVDSDQKKIQNFEQSSSIPEGMAGGILFDGSIISLSSDNEGNSIVTFHILKMLLKDSTDPSPETLIVTCPPLGYGGIAFKIGASYRVFAVKLNNQYQTWGSTGKIGTAVNAQ